MRIAEYKQIDTEVIGEVILVDDYNEDGEIIGQHEETVTKEKPIMGLVYRDATEEELAEMLSAEEPIEEPTQADWIEAQVLYTALMTDTLLEE